MVVRFIISSNANKYVRDNKRRKRNISTRMNTKLREIAKVGKNYAFQIAPKQTGKTARGVHFTSDNKSNIVLQAQEGHPNKKWRGHGRFRLTEYMHGEGAESWPWRGEPRFMIKTSEYLRTRFGVRYFSDILK